VAAVKNDVDSRNSNFLKILKAGLNSDVTKEGVDLRS
jgi:hypothetical protein